jgi:hypothetical protein
MSCGFIALALVMWVLVENRRFEGPPTGDRDRRAQGSHRGGRSSSRRTYRQRWTARFDALDTVLASLKQTTQE